MATSPRTSRAEAVQRWREARSWYEKSLTLWVDKRGALESDERDEQQNVADQIARCDAALHESSIRQH